MKGASFAPTGEASALELVPTRVTVWVKIFRRLKVRTFYIAKRPENHCFRGILWS